MYWRLWFPAAAAGAYHVAISGLSLPSTVIDVWLIKLLFCGIDLITSPTLLAGVPDGMIGSVYCVVPSLRNQVAPLSGDCANMMFEFVCHAGDARHVQLIVRSPVDVNARWLM